MPTKIRPMPGIELRRLMQDGNTLASIAKQVGVSTTTVHRWARQLRIDPVSQRGRPRTDPNPRALHQPLGQAVERTTPSDEAIRNANIFGL